jgi:hypothetical protein
MSRKLTRKYVLKTVMKQPQIMIQREVKMDAKTKSTTPMHNNELRISENNSVPTASAKTKSVVMTITLQQHHLPSKDQLNYTIYLPKIKFFL